MTEKGGVETDDIRPIDNLLLNGPGEQTRKLMKDFFIRRDLTSRACPDCVVLMLAAKQFYASGSGSGFRVSPRGGGPLTTLIEFTDNSGAPAPLWATVYANVLPLSAVGSDGLTDSNALRILPWLAPLRVSKEGRADVPTTLDHAHPFQVFFPMPARVEMIWEDSESAIRCDVCGGECHRHSTGWKTLQYGVQYLGLDHPLTPYRISADGEKFTLKPKLQGVSYPDWVAITLGAQGKSAPARNIQEIKNSIQSLGMPARIRAYGYQMENASALAWHESVVPFVDVPEHLRLDFAIEVGSMVGASQEISSALVSHVKAALYNRPKDASGDFSHIQREFMSNTTAPFYRSLPAVVKAMSGGDIAAVKRDWLSILQKEALRLFEQCAPLHMAEERSLERLVKAYRKFSILIRSRWADGLLNLATTENGPETKTVKKAKGKKILEETP